ncbi:MAG TPA: site-specific DNA-methyltransferase [Candidatus Sumerlaeota bacterium]|nr:MAG: Modification methylase RsrI [candidate division BRC1 bacterium ADurb.BinA292]HOE95818.1 site-specific DNA-methyltransferase [Candidatus Sumerlaeota bacterium]HOR29635.1 site-specific DNA-methyltransferase [Candidatus Sumerlaeota bacterium]HPK03716.1 site-specific DNA-methyltransferase [Candidatus Sumerlaeota bacterium]
MKEARQADLFGEMSESPEAQRPVRRKKGSPPVKPSKATVELIHGDFLKRAPAVIADGSIDVIVTSPPYNLNIKYSKYNDDLPRQEYLAWTDRWAAEAKRCLAPQGSLFLNVGVRPREPWGAWEVAEIFRRHFALQNVIHWIKSISIAKADVGDYPGIVDDVTVGHYKPINSNRYVNDQHEYIFHLSHQGNVELDRTAIGVPYQDASNVTRWKSAAGGLHCRGNTWFMPYETINFRDRDRPHPASFPLALPDRCLRLHGVRRIRRVLDPFAGLGTTLVAAARLDLDAVGFDIDEAYLAVARDQLARTGCKVR